MSEIAESTASRGALETMVAEADTGGRKPGGIARRIVFAIALAWSLFQLWYAAPLAYMLNFGVFNDGQARIIHLSFAFLLAFTTFPARKSSPRDRIPASDWTLALLGVAAAMYLLVFYAQISLRPGLPTTADIVVSVIGTVLLLEAARRAVGPALAGIAALMLVFMFAGPSLPGLLAHKGATLSRAASQMWLTSEGIFGVALGVSTSLVFLFVLFGSLLEKAGAGNYFIQLAFAMLGQFRGGPAKAGVVASGMTGMISGSSIANTVTTGTFTIPLMKRVGYPAVKAGAIECAAGVNGQLMPPVMGAAAFLIAEYVGITYAEVVKHAFVPAFLTYGALFYIVDIEAAKMGMRGLERARTTRFAQAAISTVMTICGIIILSGLVYWGIGWTKTVFGSAASVILGAALVAIYLALLRYKARHPDLPLDDPSKAKVEVPNFFETARTGLHFLLPVIVLIWCLMAEEMSPGLSAFWGAAFLIVIVLTQRPLTAFFRGEGALAAAARAGWVDLVGAGKRGAQHDRRRHRHRDRRHHRRRGRAHRHRPCHDGDRRIRLRRQSVGDARADRRNLPRARDGNADDGQLCRRRHVDGAGAGRTRGTKRPRRAADRRSPVCLLFRIDGRRHPARRACRVCRRRYFRRRPGEDRDPRFPLRNPYWASALHLHFQFRAAADRHRRCLEFSVGRQLRDYRHGLLCRGDAGMAVDP
jgi:TRAP transporter 4TM/12TM fusion protein